MDTDIIIHKSEQINGFLCGKQQKIGLNTNKVQNEQVISLDNNVFSKYPFPDPIEPSHTNQPRFEHPSSQSSHISQSGLSEYNKLRQDESLINNVSNYLHVYDINSKRKIMILHQEIKERYLQPLAKKLVKKTNGVKYKKFIHKKEEAITSFDKQVHSQDIYNQKLPQIPLITYYSGDLTDPILKYRKNNDDEKRLTKIIQESTGQWQPPSTFIERDTMNLKKYKILAETRFYGGELDSSTAKGKKIYPEKYCTEISTELNNFAPPIEKKQYVHSKNAIQCQMDHIKFGE